MPKYVRKITKLNLKGSPPQAYISNQDTSQRVEEIQIDEQKSVISLKPNSEVLSQKSIEGK